LAVLLYLRCASSPTRLQIRTLQNSAVLLQHSAPWVMRELSTRTAFSLCKDIFRKGNRVVCDGRGKGGDSSMRPKYVVDLCRGSCVSTAEPAAARALLWPPRLVEGALCPLGRALRVPEPRRREHCRPLAGAGPHLVKTVHICLISGLNISPLYAFGRTLDTIDLVRVHPRTVGGGVEFPLITYS
jgi:hypothetical protein